nr:P44/Msp2 family outer membrane protein [Wolbachia endosymbiont of Ctenocephalides felis wCfeT]
MISKKTLAITAMALLLSQQSSADGWYIGGGYHNQIHNSTSALKVKIGTADATAANKVSINDRDASNTKGQLIDKYKGDYNPPFAANVAIGYAGELNDHSYKAELEGMYSSIKVDNIGLASSQMTVSYIKDPGQGGTKNYGVIVNHDQIENASLMANVYHHWKSDRFSFSPYIGIGGGMTRMKMFEQTSWKPAYQVKAGLDYKITDDTNVHIGYRHFGAIGTDIKLKAGEITNGQKSAEISTTNTQDITISNKLFATHSVELGLTVNFASQ